ncbi:MAG TPA: sialate O-acetylesterase [Candidatus Binatia bacterium]|nr:sialate O-acetylesterase [Candidatus Binatia bacterium]
MQRKFLPGLILLFTACIPAFAANDVHLPFVSPMFGDNMVLQRGKPNMIWGWSTPGDAIHVEISGHKAETVAGESGRWEVKIAPPAPGGPYTLNIEGAQHVQLRAILVGDVWLCGGQSNMELPLERTRNGAAEIAVANHPEIRLFKVQSHVAYSPAAVPRGEWEICSPKTIAGNGGFSAVAYYFALKVQSEVHVPIGLIEDCVGGTPAESWTSPATLRILKDFDAQLDEIERLKARGGPAYGNYVMPWYDEFDIGQKSNWFGAGFDDSNWKTVTIPGGFQELGVPDTPAVCWFRKDISLPDPLPPGKATISLGVIERMDTTYVNGQWIGASAWVENPRMYSLKEGILKPGKNVIAIRVFKTKPQGGFMSKADALCLTLGNGAKIPLAGEWRGALSVDAKPPHPLPLSFENWPVMPSVLYQGMIQPVAPLAISGAIWYQGEANADRPQQYQKLLPAMIGDWRQLFGQGDFPFYIVSLPAFMHHQNLPPESGGWAELREAQAMTARTVKNSALAVTIDTGDPDNIHPPDKKIVGDRLALCALGQYYGKKIPYQGPTFQSLEHVSGALKIHFDHTDGGLVAKGGQLGEFSIAGKDHKWRWAAAKIDGDGVIVSSPKVPEPEVVRYAWQSNPTATLFNGAGLPAVPFRTDHWPEAAGQVGVY